MGHYTNTASFYMPLTDKIK